MASEHHRIVCNPTLPDDHCLPCNDEDVDQQYCVANSFKQQVKCHVEGANTSDPSAHYVSYQSCPDAPADFMGFVKFELLMLIIFVFSFRFVQKRKRRLQIMHLSRIESYL